MKVKEKVFVIVEPSGKPIDLTKEKKIVFPVNGEHKGYELRDLFIRYTLERNSIVGYSLLQYFNVKDGLLVDREGNTVGIYLEDKKIELKFKEITTKFVSLDPVHVTVSIIEAFSNLLIGIKHPEIVFTDLSNAEKKEIVMNREEQQEKQTLTEKERELLKKSEEFAEKALDSLNSEDVNMASVTLQEYKQLPNASEEKAQYISNKITEAQNKITDLKAKEAREREEEEKAFTQADAMADKAVQSSSNEDVNAAREMLAECKKFENTSKEKIKTIEEKIAKAEQQFIELKEQERKKAKADRERKAKVNHKFLYHIKDYAEQKDYFAGIGGAEYTKENYHFFHAPKLEEDAEEVEPLLLIKRGADWWEEPETAEIASKNEKVLVYDFIDEKKRKVLTLDLDLDQINVEEVKK